MSKQDYYSTLGVSKDVDEATLKKAYRKKAMENHPDRNPGNAEAEQRFKDATEAYEVLKDPQKRAAYDRFGHDAFQGGMGGGAGGFGGAGGGAAGFDFGSAFSDIFEDLFGGGGGFAQASGNGGRSGGAARGADLRYNLAISLEDAFTGKQQNIKVTTSVACEPCKGSGAEAGSKPVTCPTCQGAGRVRAQQGFFTVERPCHSCGGVGEIIEKPCKQCAGSGKQRKEKSLAVSIPAGVEEGTRIRLSGEGEAGARGGPSGDLYIFLSVASHPIFKRHGADLHAEVPITFTTATLGGEVEVPTVDGGRVKVTIPAGTQTGRQFRLRGKGMSIMRSSSRGDMYMHAQVETPVNLSKKQRELLREFEKEGGGKHNSPESESFFGKVKEFWDDLSS